MRFDFDREMALSKYAESYSFLQVFSSLYRGKSKRHWRGAITLLSVLEKLNYRR